MTLLDRPYRRLVDDIPLRYIGFTVPDELFAGYGLGLDERWRAFPDLHHVVPIELPRAATEAASPGTEAATRHASAQSCHTRELRVTLKAGGGRGAPRRLFADPGGRCSQR